MYTVSVLFGLEMICETESVKVKLQKGQARMDECMQWKKFIG
jgi:hypothetical protein